MNQRSLILSGDTERQTTNVEFEEIQISIVNE